MTVGDAAPRGLLGDHDFVANLPTGTIDLIAPLAETRTFRAGSLLFTEGTPADALYLVMQGHVAIEIHAPERGAIVVETLAAGSVVGLSWAAAPYRYQFDARAVDDIEVVRVDAEKFRTALNARPEIGSAVYERLIGLILDRLQATRVRLLDLYGHDGDG
jgi:CRP-like cAMP-binding protein